MHEQTSPIPNIEVTDACKILGRCRKTVIAWIKSGKLQAVKIGGRYRTMQEWIEAMAIPVVTPRPIRTDSKGECPGQAARKRLQARFGFKEPTPKLRRRGT